MSSAVETPSYTCRLMGIVVVGVLIPFSGLVSTVPQDG